MQENTMEKIGTCCLLIIIVILIFFGGKYTYAYYNGKQYVVDKYIEALKEKDYEMIYKLTYQDNEDYMGKEEFVKYYKYYYESYNVLTNIEKRGWDNDGSYVIWTLLGNKQKVDNLILVNDGHGWKIEFPFEYSNVSVVAPIGVSVKLNEEELLYSKENKYIKDKLLPGKYLLSVDFAREDINKYSDVIELPDDKEIVLACKVGNLKIDRANGLNAKVGNIDLADRLSVKDILIGEYEMTVFHPEGYIEPINNKINIVQGENTVSERKYELSKQGNDKLVCFMKKFYEDYKEAIVSKDKKYISQYFSNQEDILEFEEWYISNKDIQASEIFYECSDVKIDEMGELNAKIVEIVNLNNKENDKIKQYRVVIGWDMKINIENKEWKILNRELKQSIVAFKDDNDRWIQY